MSEVALSLVGRVAYPAETRLRHANRPEPAGAGLSGAGLPGPGLARPDVAGPQLAGRYRGRLASQPRLNLVLDRIGQLYAAAGEELDPVVWRRVMARREHDAELRAHRCGQVGDGGSRHNAEPDHIDAAGG